MTDLDWLKRPCGDHQCVWGHPGGMGTNSGCAHGKNLRPHEMRILIRALAAEMRELRKDRAELDSVKAARAVIARHNDTIREAYGWKP